MAVTLLNLRMVTVSLSLSRTGTGELHDWYFVIIQDGWCSGNISKVTDPGTDSLTPTLLQLTQYWLE